MSTRTQTSRISPACPRKYTRLRIVIHCPEGAKPRPGFRKAPVADPPRPTRSSCRESEPLASLVSRRSMPGIAVCRRRRTTSQNPSPISRVGNGWQRWPGAFGQNGTLMSPPAGYAGAGSGWKSDARSRNPPADTIPVARAPGLTRRRPRRECCVRRSVERGHWPVPRVRRILRECTGGSKRRRCQLLQRPS